MLNENSNYRVESIGVGGTRGQERWIISARDETTGKWYTWPIAHYWDDLHDLLSHLLIETR